MNFAGLTVFVLANNETVLLEKTIQAIKNTCADDDLHKIIIVVKNRICSSCSVGTTLSCSDSKVEVYVQQSDTAQECIAELPNLVNSSHFVIMAADMEMDPSNLGTFIAKAKKHPERIICAAKWMKESTVIGYGFLHSLCSKSMNRFISILFKKKVYDPFSIYQIYPIEIYKKLDFDLSRNFLYEYTLKPLNAGFEYEEIPTVYIKRKEGKSNFGYVTLFKVGYGFIITSIKIRLDL